MEIYSSTTRFAFACNQSNKIIEPLQSRCAILRYGRLTDTQVVKRLMEIMEMEGVESNEEGVAALVFTAEGDMRQAINNLQSTVAGFGFVNSGNVFKVVDSPHPVVVQEMVKACSEGKVDVALERLEGLWGKGYSAVDVVTTMFRVVKGMEALSEAVKLEFIRVGGIIFFAMAPLICDVGDWLHAHACAGGRVHAAADSRAPRTTDKNLPSPRTFCHRYLQKIESRCRSFLNAYPLCLSKYLRSPDITRNPSKNFV